MEADRLPGAGDPLPVWLWSSKTGMTGEDVDLRWQAFLRRFDLEHTLRVAKQTLGWTRPKIRTPEAADRCTWLVISALTQLRLGRPLVEDFRRPPPGGRNDRPKAEAAPSRCSWACPPWPVANRSGSGMG